MEYATHAEAEPGGDSCECSACSFCSCWSSHLLKSVATCRADAGQFAGRAQTPRIQHQQIYQFIRRDAASSPRWGSERPESLNPGSSQFLNWMDSPDSSQFSWPCGLGPNFI